MTESPAIDRGRLGQFIGLLVITAVGLLVIARVLSVSPVALAPVYMFTPLVAALIVCRVGDLPLSSVGLRVGRPRWLAVSAIGGLPLVGVMLVLATAAPGVGYDPTTNVLPGLDLPSGPIGIVAAIGLVLALGATVNALFALGEEFGWRGYLLWELAPLGFWRASFVIGAIWGLWHTPVIVAGYNFPSFPYLGVVAMTVACLSFSPVYTYLVIRANSVLAAALFHGVFNGSAGVVIVFAVTDDPVLDQLVASPVGLAGILTFGLLGLGIALAGAPLLTRASIEGGQSARMEPQARSD